MILHSKRWRMCALAAAVGLTGTVVHADPSSPRKIVAALDVTQNFGTTKRAVSFYDVTDLSGSNVFNQQPLFSVWTGYEDSAGLNFEDPDSITVNPINGTVYLAAFDSGPAGVVDATGDTQGDIDLYRIDYQEILNDFITNGRAQGTMYAPTTGPDGAFQEDHPDNSGTTVFIDNAITKVGEIGRTQGTSFFDRDIEFIRPDQLVMVDNENDSSDTVAQDHQIRLIERVSTTSGSATFNAGTNEGGFNNGAESWESNNGGVLDMDNGTGFSEPEDISLAVRDGVVGIWVGETDGPGGGDDLSFFELDFNAMTATKLELQAGPSPFPTGFALDEDPTVDPASNDGEHDATIVDENGNLIIIESGFFDTPAEEPKIITRDILDYNVSDSDASGVDEVQVGGWGVSSNLPAPTADDDTGVTDGRFVTYDKGTGYIYFFDIDGGSLPDVVSDVYVFDPSTGSFVYEEQNAANHFLVEHGVRLFLRGDTTGDGLITADDIDLLYSVVTDPTLGGTVTSALGQEWYDLTGDFALTGTPGDTGDVDELVREILGTEYGDANLDGLVNISDLTILGANFGLNGGWALGDFTGDGLINISDLTLLGQFFGFGTTSGPSFAEALQLTGLADEFAAIPEPTTLTLLMGLGVLGVMRRRRA